MKFDAATVLPWKRPTPLPSPIGPPKQEKKQNILTRNKYCKLANVSLVAKYRNVIESLSWVVIASRIFVSMRLIYGPTKA